METTPNASQINENVDKQKTVKLTWNNPYKDRVWHQCGACQGKVSKTSTSCRHCGAEFQKADIDSHPPTNN